jgi:predicted nuclease of predicted toxin-antitoxin system
MATIRFYFDEMMSRIVANRLQEDGYDVILAVDAGMRDQEDDSHLSYATTQGRVLVTQDRPFAGRAAKSATHAGLVCWTRVLNDFGAQIRAFSDFADTNDAESIAGQVYWIK